MLININVDTSSSYNYATINKKRFSKTDQKRKYLTKDFVVSINTKFYRIVRHKNEYNR